MEACNEASIVLRNEADLINCNAFSISGSRKDKSDGHWGTINETATDWSVDEGEFCAEALLASNTLPS